MDMDGWWTWMAGGHGWLVDSDGWYRGWLVTLDPMVNVDG